MDFRSAAMRIFVLCFGLSYGCAADAMKDSATATDKPHSSTSTAKTASDDKPKKDKDGDSDWNDVGRQARGDRPMEKENDPLRNLFVSPQAQEIERSLGVD
jgi:hypothetical protein